MKQSQLFTKTRFEAPKDEVAKNAQILIRAGFIHKEMAGVYSLLPLGLSVVNKIKKIVNDEMLALGSNEILMSSLQNKELWEKTDRWDDAKVDIWFKSKFKNDNEVGLGWSHEEPITEMMKFHIGSYNDLPRFVHQFQNKFRNEVRAKSGIMRCREFIMKDMYSFTTTEEAHMDFYNKTIDAYKNVFKKVGLGDSTYVTSASGGVFTDKFSHEFQTICDAGEDVIYVNKDKHVAINEEIFNKETLEKLEAKESDFEKVKTAEVGNIFTFGTEKCEQLGLMFKDKEGNRQPVFLGSYGIGITRLMGVIAEKYSDEKGASMVWPETVAPFKVHLIELSQGDEGIKNKATKLYEELVSNGVEVLFDDRDMRAGEKFADADLIGIAYRIVISKKTEEAGVLEYKNRITNETLQKTKEEVLIMLR